MLKLSHAAMDTVFEIAFVRGPKRYAQAAAQAAFAELDRLEAELSRFRPGSDIARINSLKAGQTALLGADATRCLELAERARWITRGAFDVAAAAPGKSPRVDFRRRLARGTGTRVDLGGIGKGYALDAMAALLKEWDAGPVLLNAGASTAFASGSRRGGWTLKLRRPNSERGSLGLVRLSHGAVSGSAAALKARHILDPATGRPAGGSASRAAWAAAPTAAMADALSTAFFASSPARMKRVCALARGIGGLTFLNGEFTLCGKANGIRFLPRVG